MIFSLEICMGVLPEAYEECLPEKDEIPSPEEQKRLAELVEEGDLEARERLLWANMRYVIDSAREFKATRGSNLDLKGLVTYGIDGLVLGLNKIEEGKYDSERGNVLNFLDNWIENKFYEYRRSGHTFQFKSLRHRLKRDVQRVSEELQEKGYSELTADELARRRILQNRKRVRRSNF